MQGTITVIDQGAVRIHSYTAPASSFNVTTQLIETPLRLIAVDGQYVRAAADEVVAYAATIGKPLDRLIITHAHPDHFNGAGRFGVPVHALPVVRDQIAAQDSSVAVVPTVEITPGTEVVDGVPLRFDALSGGEAADELVIELPGHGVLVAGDLVYNRTHLFLGHNDITGWIAAVGKLAARGCDTILPGHGLPATPVVFDEMAAYLREARRLLGNDGEAYKRAITAWFPGWGSELLIDIGNSYLFGQAE